MWFLGAGAATVCSGAWGSGGTSSRQLDTEVLLQDEEQTRREAVGGQLAGGTGSAEFFFFLA